LDNATFVLGAAVAPGDVCIVKGDQLSLGDPASAAGFPLPTSLGGATVLVNYVLAPLYYTSFGQIAFQMPYTTTTGTALVQVVRDGQAGNAATVNVNAAAAQILVDRHGVRVTRCHSSNESGRDADPPGDRAGGDKSAGDGRDGSAGKSAGPRRQSATGLVL